MKFLGSKPLESKRLLILPQTMKEAKTLWEILCMDEVNKYYLTIPKKFKERFKDWSIQEPFYKKKIENINNETFQWSIFIKDTKECIGQISVQEKEFDKDEIVNKSIRDIGWFINPRHQGKGYAKEAASKILEYMFNEVGISEIKTSAAVCNKASWKLMESLGFTRRSEETHLIDCYTFVDDEVEGYSYGLTKEEYLKSKK